MKSLFTKIRKAHFGSQKSQKVFRDPKELNPWHADRTTNCLEEKSRIPANNFSSILKLRANFPLSRRKTADFSLVYRDRGGKKKFFSQITKVDSLHSAANRFQLRSSAKILQSNCFSPFESIIAPSARKSSSSATTNLPVVYTKFQIQWPRHPPDIISGPPPAAAKLVESSFRASPLGLNNC